MHNTEVVRNFGLNKNNRPSASMQDENWRVTAYCGSNSKVCWRVELRIVHRRAGLPDSGLFQELAAGDAGVAGGIFKYADHVIGREVGNHKASSVVIRILGDLERHPARDSSDTKGSKRSAFGLINVFSLMNERQMVTLFLMVMINIFITNGPIWTEKLFYFWVPRVWLTSLAL